MAQDSLHLILTACGKRGRTDGCWRRKTYAPAARARIRFRGTPSKFLTALIKYTSSYSQSLQRAANACGALVSLDSISSCRLATFAETGIGSPHRRHDTPR